MEGMKTEAKERIRSRSKDWQGKGGGKVPGEVRHWVSMVGGARH